MKVSGEMNKDIRMCVCNQYAHTCMLTCISCTAQQQQIEASQLSARQKNHDRTRSGQREKRESGRESKRTSSSRLSNFALRDERCRRSAAALAAVVLAV